ncbi:bifunctional 4-hydroxy-2-oxoglutarate aldolase/2-dehydro-3-deoxy-phosphogluconate aldolase [Actinokineospora globicatena]|uniref:bifunctional 4-hydroxy-2-oxoglutarate aldolase/2-dehydro-3-deoxy-phosphogluconate aldolase n=1 Tax=Actinokineospora globicatena TaxID=103729 RepID=UPI0020A45A58|nr:bifunctional 4-hydroxy-2-oxoglutarate aldolase/2-dehydro-3-deoxy-phosphogluconate aldolase [Actinokineospora globicatena]MCP2305076.1 2-dehydro-3-deoxyphosphogluconate aldolase / (4S)-4-hydroxy-2-oxoglutarate aldolase [Actinokineospora globicatena]GLW80541.1 2-dehydro-3-deoxy-phosphogluconate aldolase [Actinokineospora globicatena]GLW87369.1 2-dehydro-3-deoxy-phosphogluconate aldolase [Actinokineospora globicatena]
MSLLDLSPVVPVVVLHDVAHAVPLAEALVRGGVRIIEVTLRTSAALESIRRIADEVPDAVVGAGTVTAPSHAAAALDAGARFLVTPGTTDSVLAAAADTGLPVLPGAATVSEAMRLAELGYQELKFFPAEAAGGIPFLKSIAGPLPALRFCPTGGITPATAAAYLALSNVACVGGSWLTSDPADVVGIEHSARAAAALA